MRPLLKICGITREEDALACAQRGADFLGFIFVPSSARLISVESAAKIIREVRRQGPAVPRVAGVFADQPVEFVNDVAARCGLDLVQLHGSEPPEDIEAIRQPVMKAFSVTSGSAIEPERYPAARWLLFDAPKQGARGSSATLDWTLLPENLGRPFFVAGGIDATNVRSLIDAVAPYGVDVSRGIEQQPGIKDIARLDALLEAMR